MAAAQQDSPPSARCLRCISKRTYRVKPLEKRWNKVRGKELRPDPQCLEALPLPAARSALHTELPQATQPASPEERGGDASVPVELLTLSLYCCAVSLRSAVAARHCGEHSTARVALLIVLTQALELRVLWIPASQK